jgi:hypothetical protein
VKFAKNETPEIVIEDGCEMVRTYNREILPQITPIAVEMPIGPEDGLRMPESGIPVKTIIDLIDQDGNIRDLKSAKSKWNEAGAGKRLQAILYVWAYRAKYGVPPPNVIFDVLVRKPRCKSRQHAEIIYQKIKCQIDPRLEFGVLRRMEAVIAQMRAGQYWPNVSDDCEECPYNVESFCANHFATQPFAPWIARPATAPTDGPRYITPGGPHEEVAVQAPSDLAGQDEPVGVSGGRTEGER